MTDEATLVLREILAEQRAQTAEVSAMRAELRALRDDVNALRPPLAVNEADDRQWFAALLPDLRALPWFAARTAIRRIPRLAQEYPGKNGAMRLGRRLAAIADAHIVVDGYRVAVADDRGTGTYRAVRTLQTSPANVLPEKRADLLSMSAPARDTRARKG